VALAVITVLGVIVRLPSFGDSLFGDELSSYYVVTGHSLGRVIHLLNGHEVELNPPLYFVLAWVSEKLFGVSAQSLKLVSLLAGTAMIPLTYVLGRRTVSVKAGIVASMFVAFSPFLIYYSTEARAYALMTLLCLLSTLALLEAVRTGRAGWWAAYAVFSCAAAYTQFTSVFLLAAQLAWALLTQRNARRPLLATNAAAVIGFLPWLPDLINTERSPLTKVYGFLEPFGLHAIRIDLGHWAIGHPYMTLATVPGTVAAVLALTGVAAAVLGAILSFWHPRRPRTVPPVRPEVALVVVLACAAPAGIALYSSFRESVWTSRNLISSWPGFAVLMAGLLTYRWAPWRFVAVGLVVVAFVIAGVQMLDTSNQRPDYGSAAAFIDHYDDHLAPVVELATATPGPLTEMEVALALHRPSQRHPVLRLGLPPLSAVLRAAPLAPLPLRPGQVVAREAATAAGTGTLFIVISSSSPISALQAARAKHLRGGTTGLGALAAFLGALPARFHPVGDRTFPGLFPVTVYVYRG
jgi:Dolichyl-phosphate-mannose-protein mannosyltransferase